MSRRDNGRRGIRRVLWRVLLGVLPGNALTWGGAQMTWGGSPLTWG